MAQLGYRPNLAARQLKTGEASMIGLLVLSDGQPQLRHVGARDRGRSAPLRVPRHRRQHELRSKHERAFIDDMTAQGVRGVIVISSLADERHPRRACPTRARRGQLRQPFPAQRPADPRLCLGRQRGRRAHGCGTSGRSRPPDNCFPDTKDMDLQPGRETQRFPHRDRRRRPEGRRHRRGCRVDLCRCGDGRTRAGACQPLARHSDCPSAAIAINDMMAIGLISGLARCGIHVPSDMSVRYGRHPAGRIHCTPADDRTPAARQTRAHDGLTVSCSV